MFQWIFNNMDMLNIAAAWIGAITGIAGLIYSIWTNKAKIKLSNCFKDRVDPKSDYQYNFKIVNTSNTTVIIKKVRLFDRAGKEMVDNDFNPNSVVPSFGYNEYGFGRIPLPPLDSGWYSEPFEDEQDLFPNSSLAFSYYLDEAPHKIKITTNKRIHFLSKSQSFSPVFKKHD